MNHNVEHHAYEPTMTHPKADTSAAGIQRAAPALARLGLGLRVTPENILGIRNALRGEAARLRQILALHSPDLRIIDCGADPVSPYATAGFNDKMQNFVSVCTGYVQTLDAAGKELGKIASDYGHAEQTITDSFTKYLNDHRQQWQRENDNLGAVAELPDPIRSLLEPTPTVPSPRTTPGPLTALFTTP